MSLFQDRLALQFILVVSVALFFLGNAAPDGLYNLDEAIYVLGAKALYETGQFGIQNGYESFASDDLRLWLLVNGPSGLVPQYPIGTTIAAAPFFGFLGQKSFILLNILAAIGSLFTSRALARRLFGSDNVANLSLALLVFCTFWSEFAVAVWPHAISFFLVSLGILLSLDAIEKETSAWRVATIAGAVVGLGMFFRLEGVLTLPAIAIVTILYAKRPVQVLVGGALGFSPMVALMVYTNWLRFDTLKPLSYGSYAGGGTDATSYISLGFAIFAVLIGTILVRNLGHINLNRKIVYLGGAGLLVLAVFLHPNVPLLQNLSDGIYAILIDAKVIEDARPGATFRLPDGTLAFWGQPKKALAQSLPWLGLLAALIGLSWKGQRRGIIIVLVFFIIWSVPFLLRSWHGGPGSNMRYLLPMLPLITALTSWLILELAKDLSKRNLLILPAMAITAFAISMFWALANPDEIFALNQIISNYVLFGVASIAVVAGFTNKYVVKNLVLLGFGIGLGLSSYLAFQDYLLAQKRRAGNAKMSDDIATIPGKAVLYGPPAGFYSAFEDQNRLVALPFVKVREIDTAFVSQACDAGYRVLFTKFLGEPLMSQEGLINEYVWEDGVDGLDMVELNCSAQSNLQ